jgi:folate-dependent tRNA-U54 methylase TrmFO/GidA
MLGALCRYVANAATENYQPMNAAFGLLAPVEGERGKKKDRRARRAAVALTSLDAWIAACGEEAPALR